MLDEDSDYINTHYEALASILLMAPNMSPDGCYISKGV